MAAVGFVLQVVGMALILVGGFRAARDLGAVERWWSSAKGWIKARWIGAAALWKRYVLRKREPVELSGTVASTGALTGAATVTVSEPAWDEMDQDEKLAFLRKRLEALRDVVDRNDQRIGGRVDDVQARLGEFEAAVEERFGGHDVRLEGILRFELAGGALVLVGTVIVLIGG